MNSPRAQDPNPTRQLAGLRAFEADLDRLAEELNTVRLRVAATRRDWAVELSPPAVAPEALPQPAPGAMVELAEPMPDRPPWWQREGAVARVLSAVGAGVLLIGLSLLLVLAIQSGYFGPVPRVVVGGVVALSLLLVGVLVHRRQPGNPGAVALAACGVAGGYLDVVAVSTIYGWVPAGPGLLLAAGVFAVGLVLSRRWGSQVLAVIVVLGVVVLAPVVGGDRLWLPSAFLVLVTVGSLLVDLDRDWPVLQVARVVPAAVVLASGPLTYAGHADATARLVDAALVTAFAVAMPAGQLWAVRRGGRGAVPTAMLGVAALPALVVVPWGTSGTTTTVWLLALAAGWAVTGWFVRGSGPRAVLLGLGALGALVALTDLVRTDLLVPGLLVVAISYLALGVRQRVVGWVGLAVAAVGLVLYLPIVGPLLDGPDGSGFMLADVVSGVLLAAAAGLTRAVTTPRQGVARVPWLVGCWAAGLLGVTGATVTAGVFVGRELGDVGTGFVAGHAVATLVWLAAAVWLLVPGGTTPPSPPGTAGEVRSLAVPSRRHSSVGMALAGLALAKLLLFDLSTLDGVVRVVAFLLAGAALLALGTVYARSMRPAAS